MKITARFQSNPKHTYEAVLGASFTDEYNNTLDSGVLVLDPISASDRLYTIKPYDICRVSFNDERYRNYLVDSFVEKDVCLSSPNYQYTINLMSETKWLEKWQMPNKAFTHSLVNGQKSLYTVLSELFNLYVPWVKKDNGDGTYTYVKFLSFGFSQSDEVLKTPCKDISLSKPTLRQAMDSVLKQVGRLVRVVDETITFIDLNIEHSQANAWDTSLTGVNYVQRSMASDSFVTSLNTQQSNILDTNNYVVNEIVGFRDYDNGIIKQKENLYVNTSLPIYDVKKLIANIYLKDDTIYIYDKHPISGGEVTLSYNETQKRVYVIISGGMTKNDISDLHVYICSLISEAEGYDTPLEITSNLIWESTTVAYMEKDTAPGQINASYVYTSTNEHCFNSSLLDKGKNTVTISYWTFFDITKLCIENGKRQQLSVNYTEMANAKTVDELSKYVYGTIGYDIGSKKITHFSDTYSFAQIWWNAEKTAIENILYFMYSNEEGKKTATEKIIDYFKFPITYEYAADSIYPFQGTGTGTANYTSYAFSISYQPMNSANILIGKSLNDEPLPITQLDTSENSITSMDDMYDAETDKANRLGNDILAINQRTSDFSSIKDVGTFFDYSYTGKDGITIHNKCDVFKRTIIYYGDFCDVSYYASKGYIMQNYSTAIQTKYRAYEYVDYSKSMTRTENAKTFALISSRGYVNGEPFASVNSNYLVSSFGLQDIEPLEYAYEKDKTSGTAMKNELSISTARNSVMLSYIETDNVSAGPYIYDKDGDGDPNDAQVGGTPQQWYIWNQSTFSENHYIGFTTAIDALKNTADFYNNVYTMPSITPFNYDIGFTLHDRDADVLTVHKDISETMGYTFQMEYYTDEVGLITWSKWLAEFNPAKQQEHSFEFYAESAFYSTMTDEPVAKPSSLVSVASVIGAVRRYPDKNLAVIEFLHLSDITIYAHDTDDDKWYRVISVSASRQYSYVYVSLNHTKTTKVYNDESGLPTPEGLNAVQSRNINDYDSLKTTKSVTI